MKLKEILLVDDNYVDNYISRMVIENEDIVENLTVHSSSIDALEYLTAKEGEFPELIFLDIKMPIMDGFEFLNEFSKITDRKISKCQIVMLSSSNNTRDLEAAKNFPYVISYLSKPLTTANLYNILELVIQNKS